MEDLILYTADRQKQAVIHDYIEYDCACGRNAYSDNDFVLKTPFDKDKLIDIGQYVMYGQTEYGGKIRSREIDTRNNVVTYRGATLRGILATLPLLSRTVWVDEPRNPTATGTPHGILNRFLANGYVGIWDEWSYYNIDPAPSTIIEAESEDTTEAAVGTYSTNGLMHTNYLYLHDNIIKRFSTVENKPITSRFSLRNGKIVITFKDAKTLYFDSSRVKLIYAKDMSVPNCCLKEYKKYYGTIEDLGINCYISSCGFAFLKPDGDITNDVDEWAYRNKIDEVICSFNESETQSGITDTESIEIAQEILNREAIEELTDLQEKPSIEILLDTEEAELDDLVVASISELQMKVTRKVVETHLKISNGIPQITYTLEG